MIALQEVENVIKDFSKDDLQNFRSWFDNFDSNLWDKQFENDVKMGKLSRMGEKALSDFNSNNFMEL
jgi:hypothetical protein